MRVKKRAKKGQKQGVENRLDFVPLEVTKPDELLADCRVALGEVLERHGLTQRSVTDDGVRRAANHAAWQFGQAKRREMEFTRTAAENRAAAIDSLQTRLDRIKAMTDEENLAHWAQVRADHLKGIESKMEWRVKVEKPIAPQKVMEREAGMIVVDQWMVKWRKAHWATT
jgi:hypothetical protein